MRFHARKSSSGQSSSNNNKNNNNNTAINSSNSNSSINATSFSSSSQQQQQQTPLRPPKHHRTNTAPEAPTLLRLPSSTHSAQPFSSTAISPGGLSGYTVGRRATATSPSTPTLLLTPSQVSTPSLTSPSYFNPQSATSGKEPRSPATKRPPAWNTSGIDNSRGPPITLITRGTADLARWTQQQQQQVQQSQQQPSAASSSSQQQQQQQQAQQLQQLQHQPQQSRPVAEFAFAQQQQLLQSGLLSPGAVSHVSQASHSSTAQQQQQRRRRPSTTGSVDSAHPTQTNTATPHILSRHNSARAQRRELPMDSSLDDYSEYGSAIRSQAGDIYPRAGAGAVAGAETTDTSGPDGEQNEDLFLNIAADTSPRVKPSDTVLRSERLRSRLARPSNRQSFPSASASPAVQPNSAAPQSSRLPASIDTKSGYQHRRASTFSITSRAQREESPMTPGLAAEGVRSRQLPLSPKSSFSSKRDQELSPHQFLAQISNTRRRPSNSEIVHTPPNRTGTYRPSNLHYSASRDQDETPHASSRHETASRADGTESLDSTGPAASVWDELDELKSRIRRIELGGKMPTTSGAVVANASERPRTATTSVTTVSSSPKQQRKTNGSPAESTVGLQTPQRIHPLLRDALFKTKHYVSPAVYRALEATATEALQLAELAGSAGLQGATPVVNTVPNGAPLPDRQVRRKADNLCRSLTDLCIELCDTKASISSPAIRSAATAVSRRPSVQINGESPSVRQSIEVESDALRHSSPSRALSRIEARRTSALTSTGGHREPSQEPLTPSQSHIPSRLNRAGTSLQRTRHTGEDDEDLTFRAPSRAMTDFRDTRSANHAKRFSREYTSREPLPELQPAPALQHTASLRRPTVSGGENHLLLRDSRRYTIDRQSSPAYEKQLAADPNSRLAQPTAPFGAHRASVGTLGLGRTTSLSRRFRGVAGE